MKTALILGLLSTNLTSQSATAAITTGNTIKHEYCSMSINDEYNYEVYAALLPSKGFTRAWYKHFITEHPGGNVVYLEGDPLDNGYGLIDRKMEHNSAESALSAALNSIYFPRDMNIRVTKADGTIVKNSGEKSIETPFGDMSLLDSKFEIKDDELIRASYVNVFYKPELNAATTNKEYYKLKFIPMHEMKVVESELFSLKSVANEIVKSGKFMGATIGQQDMIKIKVIAGHKVDKSERQSVSDEELAEVRQAFILLKAKGKLDSKELSEKINTTIPSCIKK
jgi:hypothetical protein